MWLAWAENIKLKPTEVLWVSGALDLVTSAAGCSWLTAAAGASLQFCPRGPQDGKQREELCLFQDLKRRVEQEVSIGLWSHTSRRERCSLSWDQFYSLPNATALMHLSCTWWWAGTEACGVGSGNQQVYVDICVCVCIHVCVCICVCAACLYVYTYKYSTLWSTSQAQEWGHPFCVLVLYF